MNCSSAAMKEIILLAELSYHVVQGCFAPRSAAQIKPCCASPLQALTIAVINPRHSTRHSSSAFCALLTMSGFEVAGVVLGVLPIVIEAIKCYDTISTKFRIFRQSSLGIQKFYNLLRVQRQLFLRESHFLLGLIDVDEKKRRVMVENATHALWTDKELNHRLTHRLGDHYEACEAAVKTIHIILEGVESDMRCFAVDEVFIPGPWIEPFLNVCTPGSL